MYINARVHDSLGRYLYADDPYYDSNDPDYDENNQDVLEDKNDRKE